MPRPTFITARLKLRPLEPRDAKALHACYGDPAAMRFWDAAPSRDVAQTKARIGRNTQRYASWAILSMDGKRFLGMVNYHNRRPPHRRLEVGYILARRHWRKGIMQEAMTAFLDYCFGALGSHRVEAQIDPGNAASRCLAEKLGFRAEGLMRDRFCVEGEYRSEVMYALLSDEWYSRHPKPTGTRPSKTKR